MAEVDHSCNQCQAAMIKGVLCHETGCPNNRKVKIDGEWVDIIEDSPSDEDIPIEEEDAAWYRDQKDHYGAGRYNERED